MTFCLMVLVSLWHDKGKPPVSVAVWSVGDMREAVLDQRLKQARPSIELLLKGSQHACGGAFPQLAHT